MTESSITEEVREMFLKLRKKSTGFINTKKLVIMIDALPGWSIEKAQVYMPVIYLNSDSDKEIFNNLGPRRKSFEGGGFEVKALGDNMQKLKETFAYIKSREVSDMPEKVKAGELIFSGLSDLREIEWFEREALSFDVDIRTGSKGLVVKGPEGETFSIGKSLGYNAYNLSEFIRWAFKETSFMGDVLDALGMDSHEATMQKERTRENTGTCPVCSREQKLKKEKLVNHGYRRPGYGYIEGNCFGVGYEPFEKSAKGCVDYLEALKSILTREQASLEEIETGKVKSLSVRKRSVGDFETIYPGDKRWGRTLQSLADNTERQIKYLSQDIEMFEEKIKNWKEAQLPWEKLQTKAKKRASSDPSPG